MPTPRSSISADIPSECAKCDTGIGSADYFLSCGCCNLAFHHKCVGFSDSAFNAFMKLQPASLVSFYCEPCKAKIAQLSEQPPSSDLSAPSDITSDDRLSKVEQQLCNITHTLDILIGKSDPDPPGHEATSTAPRSYAAAASKGVTSQARVVTISDLHTIKEEDNHRRSLVIAGLPESGQDLDAVSELCKFLDPSATVCDVFRIGRIARDEDGNPGRPRLLKAHLPSSSVVRSLLSEAKNLKNSEQFKGVFIRRSMTLEERQELPKVRSQCKEINAGDQSAGVKYVLINNKIVRFTGCNLEGDRLVGGSRDKAWTPPTGLN